MTLVRSRDVIAQQPTRHRNRPCWAILGCLAIVGCSELPPDAVLRIRQSDRAYRLARFDESERLAAAVIRDHPAHADAAEAYYLRGLSRIRSGDQNDGRRDMQTGLKLCDRPQLEALLQLAHLAYGDGRYGPAARLYERSLNCGVDQAHRDEIWFRYGLSLQRGGAFPAARTALERVRTQWPAGSSAARASANLAWRSDFFSVQCGAYTSASGARTAAGQLRRDGIDVYVTTAAVGGDLRHLVCAGHYPDHAAARRGLNALRHIQPDAFIVP